MPNLNEVEEVDLTLFTKEQLIIFLSLQHELDTILYMDDPDCRHLFTARQEKQEISVRTLHEAVKRGEITTSD